MSWQNISKSEFSWIEALGNIKVREDILARVVRWQLAKRRSGNHETKEEGEVSGSGHKIYKQKGTGNARQGSKRGPHFRKGAVIFGPLKRDHSYSLPKKVRALGLMHALAAMIQRDKLHICDDLQLDTYKTAKVKQNIAKFLPEGAKKALFVDEENDNLLLGVRNCYGFDVIPSCGLNVYDILKHDRVVITKSALQLVYDRIADRIEKVA